MSKFNPNIIQPKYHTLGAACVVFAVWLVGFMAIPAMGISWDENVQRQLGLLNYDYINGINQDLLQFKDRVYGVAIELPLIYLEKWLNLEDSRSIFLFRHYFTYTLFCLSAFVFFLLAKTATQHKTTAWFALAIFLCCPRIFGHAFFNSKDIPFLCFQIFSLYALYKALFLEKIDIKWILIYALLVGILINIRILGVATFAVGIAAMIIQIYLKKDWNTYFIIPVSIGISGIVLYLTWPYLWADPVNRFLESYEIMSQFPWDGTTRFLGENLQAGDELSTYIFEWLRISIPIVSLGIIILSTIALPFVLRKHNNSTLFALFMLALSWGIIAIVIYKNSVIYDDWRHLYFIWPALIWPAILAWDQIYVVGSKLQKNIFKYVILINTVYTIISLAILHPYYYVYFNEFVSKKENNAIKQFEGDYWGLSYLEGIKYILATDPSDEIKIMTFTQEREPSFLMLSEEEKKRAKNIHNINEAHYILTIFRFHSLESNFTPEFDQLYYEIHRNGGPILRVWRKR